MERKKFLLTNLITYDLAQCSVCIREMVSQALCYNLILGVQKLLNIDLSIIDVSYIC